MALWAVVVAMLAVESAQTADDEYPAQIGYVNDYANMLIPGERARLEHELLEFYERTDAEVFLITLEDAAGMNPSEYAAGTIKSWGPAPNNAYIFIFRKEGVFLALGMMKEGSPLWTFSYSSAMQRLEKERNLLFLKGKPVEATLCFVRGVARGLEEELARRKKIQ